ncbi:MAG: hypothetical protein KatS3mg110_0567 [Pirellulaceae bacterium]|nr:MAG: hypothetical protein KatS3mg110_0567 [Pirellulaceae bacterium]
MSSSEPSSVQTEQQHHRYAGNTIPWYVHLIWISFWIFAVYYTLRFLVPALRIELNSPP